MAETCYRHPDRETGVSCSECARPICPDCMVYAAVGVRCPECARQGTRAQSPRLMAGGGALYATYVLIAVNVIVFLAGGSSQFTAEGGGTMLTEGGLNGRLVEDGEWWRIFTSGFLHAGVLHVALNMYVLYIMGTLLEPAIGTARFAGIYAVSLVAGSLGALLVEPEALTVGASGAVYGMFAATIIVARQRGVESIASQLGLWLALNLVLTFSIPGISIGGHLGGLVGGALATVVVLGGERMRTAHAPAVVTAGLVTIALASLAGALWAAGQPGL